MDMRELETATAWIREFGYYTPGTPVLRPTMLTYQDTADRRETRKLEAVNRAIGRIEERSRVLSLGLPFAFRARTAIMPLAENSAFPKVEGR